MKDSPYVARLRAELAAGADADDRAQDDEDEFAAIEARRAASEALRLTGRCRRGHPLTDARMHVNGYLRCRTCDLASKARARERARLARIPTRAARERLLLEWWRRELGASERGGAA